MFGCLLIATLYFYHDEGTFKRVDKLERYIKTSIQKEKLDQSVLTIRDDRAEFWECKKK